MSGRFTPNNSNRNDIEHETAKSKLLKQTVEITRKILSDAKAKEIKDRESHTNARIDLERKTNNYERLTTKDTPQKRMAYTLLQQAMETEETAKELLVDSVLKWTAAKRSWKKLQKTNVSDVFNNMDTVGIDVSSLTN